MCDKSREFSSSSFGCVYNSMHQYIAIKHLRNPSFITSTKHQSPSHHQYQLITHLTPQLILHLTPLTSLPIQNPMPRHPLSNGNLQSNRFRLRRILRIMPLGTHSRCIQREDRTPSTAGDPGFESRVWEGDVGEAGEEDYPSFIH